MALPAAAQMPTTTEVLTALQAPTSAPAAEAPAKDPGPFAQQLAAAKRRLDERGHDLEDEIRVVSERLKGLEDELRENQTPDRITRYDELARRRDDLQAEQEQLRTLVDVYQNANDSYATGNRAVRELKDFQIDLERGVVRFRPGETAVLEASLRRQLSAQKVQQEQEALRQRRLEEIESELKKPNLKRAKPLEQERETLLAYRETQAVRRNATDANLVLWQTKLNAARDRGEAVAVSRPVTQSQSTAQDNAATALEAENKRRLAEKMALDARKGYSDATQERIRCQQERDRAIREGRDTTGLDDKIRFFRELEDSARRQTYQSMAKKQEAQLKQQIVDMESRIQQARAALENTRSGLGQFTQEERNKLASQYRASAAELVKAGERLETEAQTRLGWVGPTEATLFVINAGQEALEKRLKGNLSFVEGLQFYEHYQDMTRLYDTERQQIDQMVTTQTVIYYQNLRLATLKRRLADTFVQTAEVLAPTGPSFFDRYKTLFRAVGILIVMIAAGYAAKLVVWLMELIAKRIKVAWPASTFSVKRVTTLASFVASISRLFIWIFGVITILYEFGINPATSSGAIGLVGLIMAGMFQQIVVDFIKGLDIIAGRHYNVGDFVEVDEKFGHVIDFSVKYTRIRTLSGQELNIPNSRCIPSRRFPEGFVDNYVDIVLTHGSDVNEAREAIDRACLYLNRRLEPIKERPRFIDRFRTVGGRPVLRYRVRVLPGCDWVITDYFIPSIESALAAKNITLEGKPKYLFINRIETFRKLFSRQLTEQEILHEAADFETAVLDHPPRPEDGQVSPDPRDEKPPVPPEDDQGALEKPPLPSDGDVRADKPSIQV